MTQAAVKRMVKKCNDYLSTSVMAPPLIYLAVNLPPQTNAGTKTALSQLYKEISKQETTHPVAALLVAGDFNAGKLKSVLPHFYQHVKCATRGKTL